MRSFRRRAGVAVTLAAGITTALTACGSSSSGAGSAGASGSASGSASAAPSADASLAAMVPAAVKSDGTITIGTDSTYAPSEFLDTDGKTVVGFDVDLFDAVAAKLGMKAQWVSAPFDNIIPSVLSGKYEIGVSSFTINADREKKTDMVSYFSAGTQWATQAGNPQKVAPDAACGKKVGVQKGTVQVDDITKRNTACTAAGKPAITIDQYQGQDQATAALVSGKDDAMLADSPVIAYAVKQTGGKLALLGAIYDSAPYGYVVKKGSGQFPQAIAAALTELKTDGTYQRILEKWGVTQGAIGTYAVNPAAS
jgi:polar amino acid transport system substrate-binding protein